MTVRTRAQLNSDADANFADNSAGLITPAKLRAAVKNLADSAKLPEDNASPNIVILSTGQSNVSLHPAYSWAPQPNLYIWNHQGVDGATHVGTAFLAMDKTTMGYDYSYANEVAKANPLARVFLITVAQGGLPIAQWKVGASAPDMYACCKNNIQAALAVLGVSKIDKFLWWQGETDADAGSATYPSDFNTVVGRFRAETWFPMTIPIIMMGICSFSGPPRSTFNVNLASLAAAEPEIRKYVHTSSLPASYWNADNTHMLAAGYEQAGKLAYLAGRSVNQSFYVDPDTGRIVVNQNAVALPAPPAGTMLHLGNVEEAGTRILVDAFGTGAASILSCRRSRGTAAAPSAVQSGDQLSNFAAFGYGATGYSGTARAYLTANAAENWTDTAQGTTWSLNVTLKGGVVAAGILAGSGDGILVQRGFSRGAPVTKTADFTVGPTDNWIICNKATTMTAILPDPAAFPGRELNWLNRQTATVVSASSNVVPKVGGSAATGILINGTVGNWVTLVSDGTNWITMRGG
ncbi:sialate O-acetylesterase [Mesorhizobium sp. AR07]|uniref:sialate O-acetylesterase n=1 Tax=Mesorhizobium sp. AR07 TaxID=2865838 RepID=UPI002160DC83|nr:sialate O-acetylesterase [Mesorhizobium sp. AR07]UVK46805.1 sialate O-acetylesterase [Mesorhizobium sp. AR07]